MFLSKHKNGIYYLYYATSSGKRNKVTTKCNSIFVFNYQTKPFKQLFISHKFAKLIKLAELNPKLTFHSLRHTFATWMVQRGSGLGDDDTFRSSGYADLCTFKK